MRLQYKCLPSICHDWYFEQAVLHFKKKKSNFTAHLFEKCVWSCLTVFSSSCLLVVIVVAAAAVALSVLSGK